jgi:signal peptidase I
MEAQAGWVLNLPRIRQRRIPGTLSSSDPQSPESSSKGAGRDPEANRSEPEKPSRQSGQDEDSWGFWRSILITLALALGIRQFLVEARFIPSGSMLPGLQLQDRLLVEKLSYRSRQPRRGEIVVFHAPHHFDPVLKQPGQGGPLNCLLVNLPVIGSLSGLQQPACDAYIKRVIGLPGDRVSVNPRGQVSINGTSLAETYVKNYCPVDARGMGPCRSLDVTVPPGHVLVLGDNRANSWDGRFWPGGPFLPQSEIIGRAFWRFFPFNAMGPLGASSSQDR